MTTDKQNEANRLNAQKSTGPRTPEGKTRSRYNAWKHGLTAEQAVGPNEDAEKWDRMKFDVRFALEPEPTNAAEEELADIVASATWRRRRAEAAETKFLAENDLTSPDFDDKVFNRIMRYRASIERELHRATASLAKMKKARQERDKLHADVLQFDGFGYARGDAAMQARRSKTMQWKWHCARQQQLKEKLDESDDLFDPTVDCDETNPFSLLPGV
ncbi:MAG: hypothetical protein AB7K09_15015, partial [Planctomycetota bacterium]